MTRYSLEREEKEREVGKEIFLGGLKVERQKVSRGGRWMEGKEDEGAAWGRGEVCRGDGMNVFFWGGGDLKRRRGAFEHSLLFDNCLNDVST